MAKIWGSDFLFKNSICVILIDLDELVYCDFWECTRKFCIWHCKLNLYTKWLIYLVIISTWTYGSSTGNVLINSIEIFCIAGKTVYPPHVNQRIVNQKENQAREKNTKSNDSHITCVTDIVGACEYLSIYLHTLHIWWKDRNLELSASKLSATLFTT